MSNFEQWSQRLAGIDEEGWHSSLPDEQDELARSPFERDIDRIKYAREFRRLKNVTQVARADEAYLFHDRLSHSLKVAQVGRRLAELLLRLRTINNCDIELTSLTAEQRLLLARGELKGESGDDPELDDLVLRLDPDIVEAACLAHDLGHPPFGHITESELDALLQAKTTDLFRLDKNGHLERSDRSNQYQAEIPDEIESPDDLDEHIRLNEKTPLGLRFEGNAQSFRILTRLASHSETGAGLGLTFATLNAIQKYPYGRGEWIYDENDDFIGYEDDSEKIIADPVGDRSREKFGFYETDRNVFEYIRKVKPNIDPPPADAMRTLASQVMDYADDMTYAIHDMVDFYRGGNLPLHRLLRESSEEGDETPDELTEFMLYLDINIDEQRNIIDGWESPNDMCIAITNSGKQCERSAPIGRFCFQHDESNEIVDSSEHTPRSPVALFEFLGRMAYEYPELSKPYNGANQQEKELKQFTSDLIEFYLGIDALFRDEYPELKINRLGDCYTLQNEYYAADITILQKLTGYYVIQDTALMGQQHGERQIIRELFEALYAEAEENDPEEDEDNSLRQSAIPNPYAEWLSKSREENDWFGDFETQVDRRARLIADIIASMTERQAVQLHQRLTGQNPGSLQDIIVR